MKEIRSTENTKLDNKVNNLSTVGQTDDPSNNRTGANSTGILEMHTQQER